VLIFSDFESKLRIRKFLLQRNGKFFGILREILRREHDNTDTTVQNWISIGRTVLKGKCYKRKAKELRSLDQEQINENRKKEIRNEKERIIRQIEE